eukprot:scaffold7935_cov43-Prasinocladus_malaysianus.AAC.1
MHRLDLCLSCFDRHHPQVPETQGPDGEVVLQGSTPKLVVASTEKDKIREKAVYFYRNNPKGVGEKTVSDDLMFGEILPDSLDTFRTVVANVFMPCLRNQESWGKCEDTKEFLTEADRFCNTLAEAVNSLHSGIELEKPDNDHVNKIPLQVWSDCADHTPHLTPNSGSIRAHKYTPYANGLFNSSVSFWLLSEAC